MLDNYGTHKITMIHKWLDRRTRYYCAFHPTSVSWINRGESRFVAITGLQIRRGTHRSTQSAEKAIKEYLEAYSENPSHSSGPKPPIKSWNH